YLSDDLEIMEGSAKILPGNNQAIVDPFLEFVININVITRAHRDSKDKGFCLVMPIGSF
ncbi:hypothetical protein K488DRAFT_26608, partial [Vararia minispora EC-137]